MIGFLLALDSLFGVSVDYGGELLIWPLELIVFCLELLVLIRYLADEFLNTVILEIAYVDGLDHGWGFSVFAEFRWVDVVPDATACWIAHLHLKVGSGVRTLTLILFVLSILNEVGSCILQTIFAKCLWWLQLICRETTIHFLNY